MESRYLQIGTVPAVLYGPDSGQVFLFVHGQNGSKEEAADFAGLVLPFGYQVLSIDLPGHGTRLSETDCFDPWHIVPELKTVMTWMRGRWSDISLRCNSLGAWFSMLAFSDEPLRQCLFVSPVLDMAELIGDMMEWAGVTAERLEREKEIVTDFGQTLSWEYRNYARSHPIVRWTPPTHILCGENDQLVRRETAETFAARFHGTVTVMPRGEHWFHTPEQLRFRDSWLQKLLEGECTAVPN